MENSVDEWRKTSRMYQQNMYNKLGDRYWDHIEDEYLPKKIGYALYSAPSVLKDGNLHYTENEMKHINKIVSHIKTLKPENSTMTYIAYVFVVVRMKADGREGIVVIFKTPKYNDRPNFGESFFIDPTCRTYKNWADYLENNNLPKCFMCYPVDGIYRAVDGIVDIRVGESPECHKAVLKVLDISSSVVTVSAAAVNIAALAFPIALPVVWGATAALVASGSYDITRGVCKLVDNNSHHQSIGLENPDARRAWINIAASGVGIAAVGGTAVTRSFKAVSGTALSSAEVLALRVINVSSLAFGSVSIASELWNVVSKCLDGTLNMQDILQFAAACFFFVNLYLSYRTAEKLIQEIASTSGEIVNLFRTTRNSDFSVVKAINTFTESSQYSLLRTLLYGVQPFIFPYMNLNDVESVAFNILRLIGKLQSGEISWDKFVLQGIDHVMTIWKRYEKFFRDAWDEMCEAFSVKDLRFYYLKTVGYQPFSSLNPDVPHCFNTITNSTVSQVFNDNTDKRNDEKKLIVFIGQEFIEQFPENNSFDYINKYKFFCDYFVGEYNTIRTAYESSLDEATSRLGSAFSREEFDKSYGITGENICHFLFNKTFMLFENNTEIFSKINSEYNEIKHSLPGLPSGFLQSESSIYYTFCGPKGQKVLTEQQYWSKAKELTGVGFNSENSTILRQKNFVLMTPSDIDIGVTALLFYGIYEKDKDCVMGVLTVLKAN